MLSYRRTVRNICQRTKLKNYLKLFYKAKKIIKAYGIYNRKLRKVATKSWNKSIRNGNN